MIFESSDLWHGAVEWSDNRELEITKPEADSGVHRESIELRFRCRCSPTCQDCHLSPITYAYRNGHIGDSAHREGGATYDM